MSSNVENNDAFKVTTLIITNCDVFEILIIKNDKR
jgi:hypothetical protein